MTNNIARTNQVILRDTPNGMTVKTRIKAGYTVKL